MINYGGSITSAFPNTFCTSPASLTCQLCNSNINESGTNAYSFHPHTHLSQKYSNPNKLEKCTHCGINICEKCLNENQETLHNQVNNNHNNRNEDFDDNHYQTVGAKPSASNQSQTHFNTVKKEFKQMYNYSKDIVEKLHLLNNAIKIEESAVGELNLIKHQVNTKALELIKQINQEKIDLIEQIENAKKKYESTLNNRKEYYALSMQYKDELRKVIRRYKEFKSEEQCSLSDLLNLYFSVKSICKSLDDYDHIKLVTEQDPLQVKFDERPTYRNLIGKLVLNQQTIEPSNSGLEKNSSNEALRAKSSENQNQKENLKSLSKNIILPENINIINGNLAKLNRIKNQISSSLKPFNNDIKYKQNSNSNKHYLNELEEREVSRSFSLNDLINAANEIITSQDNNRHSVATKHHSNVPSVFTNLVKTKHANKSNPILSKRDENDKNQDDKEDEIFKSNLVNSIKSKFEAQTSHEQKKIPIIKQQTSLDNQPFYLSNQTTKNSDKADKPPPIPTPPAPPLPSHFTSSLTTQLGTSPTSNLKSSSIRINQIKQESKSLPNINEPNKIENFKPKNNPKQRLEIDILPSHLSCSNNKLLISSSFGKIRVIDLFSYKIQKDELKNLLINGICMPKRSNPELDNEILYAVTNGQMNEQEDVLNISNSAIVVTKRELKVLKMEEDNLNDDYVFLNPSGICYDSYENLYICDSGFNRVKVLDKNLKINCIIETASNAQDKLSQPKSISTQDDVLFICDSANHRIVSYFILDQGKEFKFKNVYGFGYGDEPGMLKYPLDCCVDARGVLYVRDHHNNRVQVFGADTAPLHFIEVNSQRETIYSMTVNENGDVYVAKMVHVQEIDKNGQLMTINKYYIDIY